MNTQAASPVDSFLAAVEHGDMASCVVWAPDAVLDATVPGWRFRKRGAAAIRGEYGRWFTEPGRFDELRRIPTDAGEVVEYSLAWQEKGVPHAAHHVHVLDVRDGLIERDTVACGGRWPASLLADMQAAQQAEDSRADA